MTQYKRKHTKRLITKKRRSQKIVGGGDKHILTPDELRELKKKVVIINDDNRDKTYWFVVEKNEDVLEKVQVTNMRWNGYKLKPNLRPPSSKYPDINKLTFDDWLGVVNNNDDLNYAKETWNDIKKGDIIHLGKREWYKPRQEEPESSDDDDDE